jgi:HD-like signal output (HDOD) protein
VELESLAIKVARSENLPVLPQIVSSVLKTADDPNASGRTLEHLIESDPAIAAKILRAANSPFYGANKVPTIGRAVSVLGFNAIRSLVVGVVFQQMVSGRPQAANFNKLSFWRHSLAVAVGCRILAKMVLPLKSEEIYVAGMLHDVGMLVLDRFCATEFDEAIRLAKEKDIPLFEAEQRVYGFDHSAVGDLLAEKWGLPLFMRSAIRYHHDIENESPDHYHTTCIVAEAETLAHQFGFNNNSPAGKYEINPAVEEELQLPTEQLAIVGKVMYDEVMRAQAAFQIC